MINDANITKGRTNIIIIIIIIEYIFIGIASHRRSYRITVVYFLLGNIPASEFYTPTFRNTLFHLHRQVGTSYLPAYEKVPTSL